MKLKWGLLIKNSYLCGVMKKHRKSSIPVAAETRKSPTAIATDDRQHLLRLIRQGEHEQQDFKYKVMDAEKLARSVSAFANTSGGRLLIGVRDDGHISGVRSEEEIFMMHAAAFKWCRPQADIKFETLYAEGKTVVIATVPPSVRKPVCALDDEGRPKAYIRIADENIVASPVHLSIWRMEASPKGQTMTFGDEERTILTTLADHPGLTLNRLVRLTRINRRQVVDTLARLIRFGLVVMQHAEQQFLFYETTDER